MPQLSVIVPIYNVAPYLRRCLDSLVFQTFQDIEIICINDGSTDNSGIILEEYCDQYPDLIRGFHIENRGLSGARNVGLNKATGDYVCFIDSDDWIELTLFEVWMELVHTQGYDVVTCGIGVVNEQNKITSTYACFDANVSLTAPRVTLETNEACNKIYHRSLWKSLTFPEGKWYEDLAVVPIVLSRASKIGQWNQVGYYYFQRAGAITKTYNERVLEILDALLTLRETLTWRTEDWTPLVVKHSVYTLIRIASIRNPSTRATLYRLYKQGVRKVVSTRQLRHYRRATGWNGALLLTLFLYSSGRYYWGLDVILQIEWWIRRRFR